MKFLTSKQFKPYDTFGKCSLKNNTGGGVYIIRKKGKVVYVGKSHKQLKKTLYRHFQIWTDKRNQYKKNNQSYERVTYHTEERNKFTVQICYINNEKAIDLLEKSLIIKLQPVDNKLKINEYQNSVILKFETATEWNQHCTENPF